jgi:hypothetical protein
MINDVTPNKSVEEDVALAGFGVKGAADLSAIEAFHLKMDFTNNTVTLLYNPKLMMHRHDYDELDAPAYQRCLEHIKRRIDWCVRKSAGEEPNFDDYEI